MAPEPAQPAPVPAHLRLEAGPPITGSGDVIITITVTDAADHRLAGISVALTATSGRFDHDVVTTAGLAGQVQTILRAATPPAVRIDARIADGPTAGVDVAFPPPPPPPPTPGYEPPPEPAPIPAPAPVPTSFTLIAWPNLAPAGATITLEAQPRGITLVAGWSIQWDWNGDGVVDGTAGGLYGALALFVTVPTARTFTPQAWLSDGAGRRFHAVGNVVTIY